MEVRHLRYFLVLAEELHFGRAAKRLFMSQPPLSRQIKELEVEIGVVLLLRNNKRVELTEAGKFFLKEARDLLQKLDAVKQQTNQIYHSFAGEIKIGYISSADKTRLGKLIQNLQDNYPYLQTKLFELSTEKQINALENGKMDIGIIRAPNPSPRLVTTKLYDDGFCLAFPKAIPIPSDFSTLSAYPFISYHANSVPVYHNQILAFCAKLGFAPNLRHECNNMSSILELVHLNAGISVVPQSVQYQYRHLAIQFHNAENLTIRTEILLAHRRNPEHPVFPILKELMLTLFEK
jgi:DNA-binding transcriptional LysR family regulator